MRSTALDRSAGRSVTSPHGHPVRVTGIMVAVQRPVDLTTTLVEAAGQARAEHRPLTIVVLSPQAWTIGAVHFVWPTRRYRQETHSMIKAARQMCALVDVEIAAVIPLRPPWAWTARGRVRALRGRLRALADNRHAEWHPGLPS